MIRKRFIIIPGIIYTLILCWLSIDFMGAGHGSYKITFLFGAPLSFFMFELPPLIVLAIPLVWITITILLAYNIKKAVLMLKIHYASAIVLLTAAVFIMPVFELFMTDPFYHYYSQESFAVLYRSAENGIFFLDVLMDKTMTEKYGSLLASILLYITVQLAIWKYIQKIKKTNFQNSQEAESDSQDIN